jgi:hypothetical protein
LGIDRELFKDFSLGISYIDQKKHRLAQTTDWLRGADPNGTWWVPYTVHEPGWAGAFGTADDADVTVYAVEKGAPAPFRLSFSGLAEGIASPEAGAFAAKK